MKSTFFTSVGTIMPIFFLVIPGRLAAQVVPELLPPTGKPEFAPS